MAQYLGVAPWDDQLTPYWFSRALIAMHAEDFAQDYFRRRAENEAKARGMAQR